MKPVVDAQVTTLPPRRVTNTLAPNVSRPGCSKTMSTSRPPLSSRIFLPSRRCSRGFCCPRLGIPEAVVLLGAVDDPLGARLAALLRLGLARDDAHRVAAARQHVLQRVAAEAAAGAPDQHDVALLHVRAVRRHEHAVGGAVGERHRGRLFPGQVLGLRHQLVAARDAQLAHAAEVALEAPHALVGVEDRVVVARGLLERDVVRVHEHAIAGLPLADRRAGAQHDAAGVRADDVRRAGRGACRSRASSPAA